MELSVSLAIRTPRPEKLTLLGEPLDATVIKVGNQHSPSIVHRNSGWKLEMMVVVPQRSPLVEE